MRAMMSVVDPGVNGTMARSGRAGQFCADANRGSATDAKAAPDHCRILRRVVIVMTLDLVLVIPQIECNGSAVKPGPLRPCLSRRGACTSPSYLTRAASRYQS